MEKGKVVVITGASAGVGRAAVRAFAARGSRVALLARGLQGLEAAAREVAALGGEALVLPTDVADADQVEAAAAAIEKKWGQIDIWVNNAMVSVFSPVSQMTAAEFRRVTDVTYLGAVYGTLSALKRMRARDRGVIVQVGSALAIRSIPLQSAYCAAKHAMAGFTESLRVELQHEKSAIQLAFLELPAVNTPQFDWVKSRLPHKAQPVPPVYQPEVIAEAIVWAASHPRRRYAIGFSTVQAVLAEKFVPQVADWYLKKNGYDSQQTSAPENPSRPFNLWEPVEGDRGAHGRFDTIARKFSLQWWINRNRGWIFAMVALSSLVILSLAKSSHQG